MPRVEKPIPNEPMVELLVKVPAAMKERYWKAPWRAVREAAERGQDGVTTSVVPNVWAADTGYVYLRGEGTRTFLYLDRSR